MCQGRYRGLDGRRPDRCRPGAERAALGDVSLTASRGELVAGIGPNGAGKTTLLTILAGIVTPDAGRVTR